MDTNHIYTAIQRLYQEKAQIEEIIARLEALHNIQPPPPPPPVPHRQGRKFMCPEERKEVSQRMKRYWAMRHGIDGAS